MLTVERYRDRQASVGKAAELAGVPVGRMIEVLAEYGVESNLKHEDYLKGLQNLRKAW